MLHLRLNEPTLGLIVLRSEGDPAAVLAADALLEAHKDDWLVREIRLYWKRVLKRVDMTSRSLIALIEPGSCFAGTLAELLFAADRSVMLAGARGGDNRGPAHVHLSALNFGAYPMGNGSDPAGDTLPRRTRQLHAGARTHGRGARRRTTPRRSGWSPSPMTRSDWDDEVRLMLEERASFSPDALTGDGGQPALRRPGDDGDAHLRPADRVAELDLPAAQRGRRGGLAEALRHRRAAELRSTERV